MKFSNIFLLVILTFTFVSENNSDNSLQVSYEKFRKTAIYWGSAQMVEELNRVVNHLKMIHGDQFTPENLDLNQLIVEMKSKGYLNPNVYINFSRDPVTWKSGQILSIAYQSQINTNLDENYKYSFEHLYRALNHENDPYIKLFALHNLRNQKASTKAIDAVVKALMSERDYEITRRFVNYLSSHIIFESLPKNIKELAPELFKIRIRKMATNAQNYEQKSTALFLNVVFSNHLPSIDASTLMYCIDRDFPEAFLVKVFSRYPQTYLEKFIVPFKEGYGSHFLTLLKIFEKFPQNKKILSALNYALVNKEKGHFNFHQGEIIHSWSRITKIVYRGNDSVYLDWYNQHLKHN